MTIDLPSRLLLQALWLAVFSPPTPPIAVIISGQETGWREEEGEYRRSAANIVDQALGLLGGRDASDEAWDLAAYATYKLSPDYPGPVNRRLLPRLLVAAFRSSLTTVVP